jgi:hypothetical protein
MPGKAFDVSFEMPESDVGIMTFNRCVGVDQWQGWGGPTSSRRTATPRVPPNGSSSSTRRAPGHLRQRPRSGDRRHLSHGNLLDGARHLSLCRSSRLPAHSSPSLFPSPFGPMHGARGSTRALSIEFSCCNKLGSPEWICNVRPEQAGLLALSSTRLGLATWPTAATRAGQSVPPAPCGTPAGPICAVTVATEGRSREVSRRRSSTMPSERV